MKHTPDAWLASTERTEKFPPSRTVRTQYVNGFNPAGRMKKPVMLYRKGVLASGCTLDVLTATLPDF